MARYVDVAIAVVGEFAHRTGETNSTTTIDLPPGQLEFLKGLKNMGTPLVAIVLGGRPLNLTWLEENVDAILFGWHPGTEGALAIAEIVAGVTDPSGRLPITFPRSTGQIPLYYNHRRTGRPLDPYARGDSRYVDERDSPLYPFGFGLSYSAVEYRSVSATRSGDGFEVVCEISNIGERFADEVVQLYIRDRVSSAARPVRELKGFERVALAAGETKLVRFALGPDELGSYGPDEVWRVEPGGFDVWVGPDSRRGVQTTITL